MDRLLTCAKAFENLLPVKYHIIIGRKGKSVNLTVNFKAVEFHHLVGLHKLHDLRLSRASMTVSLQKTKNSPAQKATGSHVCRR